MPEPKYSPEVIRRYRELDRARGFERDIVSHDPVSPDYDRLRLACGHEREGDYKFYETFHQLREKTGSASVRCHQCIKEWLEKASREEEDGEKEL